MCVTTGKSSDGLSVSMDRWWDHVRIKLSRLTIKSSAVQQTLPVPWSSRVQTNLHHSQETPVRLQHAAGLAPCPWRSTRPTAPPPPSPWMLEDDNTPTCFVASYYFTRHRYILVVHVNSVTPQALIKIVRGSQNCSGTVFWERLRASFRLLCLYTGFHTAPLQHCHV
jgi:hypothetical protein